MNGCKGRLERSLLGTCRTNRVPCSRWSGFCDLRCSSKHAAFLLVVGGRIPEMKGRKSVEVDLIQPEIVRMASFNWVSNLHVCTLWHQAWDRYSAGAYTKALVEHVKWASQSQTHEALYEGNSSWDFVVQFQDMVFECETSVKSDIHKRTGRHFTGGAGKICPENNNLS